MIYFNTGEAIFQFRVAGIFIREEKLLLHKLPQDNYWSLPGGRVDLMEFSKDTLIREISEEMGKKAIVSNLCCVCENVYASYNTMCHEIGFYYRMEIPDLNNELEFSVVEKEKTYLFKWFELQGLHALPVYPDFIKDINILKGSVPHHITMPLKDLSLLPDSN